MSAAMLCAHLSGLSPTLRGPDMRTTQSAETLSKRADHFELQSEITIARAPGRLDVMGGIADYSGSLVLELPIAEATFVALQSDNANEWAAYVAGVFLVLMRERGVRFNKGIRLLISSRVPEGKGVSSSAALEVATMSAVAAAFEIEIAPREIAMLCQRVENLVVGAPCGVMDQMSVACGEANQLLAMICQPAELLGTIKLPEDLAVWGLDSGTRHSIRAGDYGSVRAGTFMGYRIVADLAGLSVEQISDRVVIDDSRWHGYLANLSPSEFEETFAPKLPEDLRGEEFLARYGGTTDTVTRVDPGRM